MLSIHLEEVSGPVLVADIGKGLERRQERGMLPHLRTSGHCITFFTKVPYSMIRLQRLTDRT
jgi:hypothetical protein